MPPDTTHAARAVDSHNPARRDSAERLAHALTRGGAPRARSTDPLGILLAGSEPEPSQEDAEKPQASKLARVNPRSLVTRYLDDCALRGLNARHILQKKSHLRRFLAAAGDEWQSSSGLLRSMRALTTNGRSPRTANFHRQIVRAWGHWLVRNELLAAHPYYHTPSLNERSDKRYVRRALTEDECDRLLAHARSVSPERHAIYACALYAGLRRSELFKLKWGAVRFDEGTIVIADGKAARTDHVPIAPPLADALRAMGRGGFAERVFPVELSQDERRADYKAAGIVLEDERGRIADLHSLRRTLHMRLVRAGVQPQVAQRIMRHADYRTTLTHYTDGLAREAACAMLAAFGAGEAGEGRASDLAGWLDACPVPMNPEVRRLVELVAASARAK